MQRKNMLSIIFLIIAGALFVGAVIGGIKPELMKNKKGVVPKKSQIIMGSSIMIFIFIVLAIVFAPAENNPAQKLQQMNLTVGQITSMQAFPNSPDAKVGWVFSIQNQNTFDWQDCSLKLNDTYGAHLNEMPVPKDKNAYEYIYENNFYKTDGTPFDPVTQKPLKITICCNKPNVDCYIGGWQ